MRRARATLLAALCTTPALALTACGGDSAAEASGGGASSARTIAVKATDSECALSTDSVPAGKNTLSIKNSGSQVTEVYVYTPKDAIVAEKENIGPGTSYKLTVELKAGSYQVACKPGMTGDGIRSKLTAKASGDSTPAADTRAAAAVSAYRAYVQKQADDSLPLVQQFTAAVKAGDVGKAKALYASSRFGWESVEPVAESFGDLDPAMDLREADLESGQEWTGWHRIEKALWTDGDVSKLGPVADQLLKYFTDFRSRIAGAELSVTSIGNGAKALIDEIATGKITGEEETFSHTDLVDFAGNLEGSEKAFEVLRPIVTTKAPDLVKRLDAAFAAVDKELATYKKGDSYVSYDTVDETHRRTLAQLIDALGEPLSQLTAAAVA